MGINSCRLIELPQFKDGRGNLTCAEYGAHIPFEIKRIFFVTDINVNCFRGGHAHKTLEQVIISVNGSFDVHLDDGSDKRTFHMGETNTALYVGPMIWALLDNFSLGATYFVLASDQYDEAEYYREHGVFIDGLNRVS